MNNNFLRIFISGSIGVALLRNANIDLASPSGFIVFVFIYAVISFIYTLLFVRVKPSDMDKDVEADQEADSEQKRDQKKQALINGNMLFAFKILAIGVCVAFVLNLLTNLIPYYSGTFDGTFNSEFEYENVDGRVIALDLSDKEPILGPYKCIDYYFLYEDKGKYYLVAQKDKEKKDRLVTVYADIRYYCLPGLLQGRKDFDHIVDNLSPVVYKALPFQDLLYQSAWSVNNKRHGFNHSAKLREMKQERTQKLAKQKAALIEDQRNRYKNLLSKDLKKLTIRELHRLAIDLYAYYAYTRDTDYIISIFDELDARGDKEVDRYRLALSAYLLMFKTKAQLNDILIDRYRMGIVYAFDLNKTASRVIFSFMGQRNSIELWLGNINSITDNKGVVVIDIKDGDEIRLDSLTKEDAHKVAPLLNKAIKGIAMIEEFYGVLTKKNKG